MKTAAKVFLILSIIVCGISAFVIFIAMFFGLPYSLILLIYVLILAIPIVIDSIALKKLENAKRKQDITTIGIVVLIFGGFLAGLFMLLTNDSDFENVSTSNNASTNDESNKTDTTDDLETKLKKLIKLRDEGLISEEEYNNARKKVIDEVSK